MPYDFDLEYWIEQYVTASPADVGGKYPVYLEPNGIEREEKSPYFENMSEVLAKRGFLYKKEFVSIGKWKAHRQINNYEANSEETVQKVTRDVLKEENEMRKVKMLTNGGLRGVLVPVASAILTVIYPREYCITDYRAWRALLWLRVVSENGQLVLDSYEKYGDYVDSLGTYQRLQNYLWYLKVLRSVGKKENKTPRQIEMALWKFDQMKGVRT